MRWFLFSIAMLTTVTAWAAAVPDTSRHETAGRVDTVYIVRTDVTADSVARVAPYVRRLNNYYRMWARLIPRGARIQYAGNMGMFSGGPTWIYGRRHWETSLMFGFVPKHNAHHAVMTMTLKQDYIPWTVHVAGELVDFQPLAAGLYFNTAFSHKFWVHQPSRYPKGYYWFATRVRTNVYLGQRIRLNIPERKRWFARSVNLFYELSTCDYYFIQKVKNSYITPDKWLTLSFGIQIEWL